MTNAELIYEMVLYVASTVTLIYGTVWLGAIAVATLQGLLKGKK